MPVIAEKAAALDELERRYGSSPELDELRRRYALPADKIDDSKINLDKPVEAKQFLYRNAYEKILTGEQEWDSFVPPEKRAILRNLPDYENNGKRLINATYFADTLGIDTETAYITHDQLASALLDSKTPKDAFLRISNRFKNGRIQVQIMNLGYDVLTGRGDEEQNLKLIQQLQGRLSADSRADMRRMIEQMAGATAEQLPIMWEGLKAAPAGATVGGITGAAAALVAGQLGPQVALPEEAITVPSGVMTGIKIGGGITAANRIRQLEAGGMYLELLEMEDEYGNKIDPRIAKVAAHAVGAINGAIELAEWAIILESFGIGTKIFENASAKVTSKFFAKGTIKHIAMKSSLKYGAALSAEVLQEIEQETSNVVFGELAKEINNRTKGTAFKPITKEDLIARYHEVSAESLKGFALIIAPGTIISGAKEVVTRKPPIEAKITKPPEEPAEAAIIEPAKAEAVAVPVTEQITQVYETQKAVEEEVEFTAQEKADLAQLEALPEEEYKPSKRKPSKAIREFLSPKSTVEKVVTEYKALQGAIKKAAQMARTAFSEGKKEGVKVAKEHYRQLKEAEKTRVELKSRIADAVKIIKKDPPKSVDFFYREAINIIQDGIDPRYRTEKTKQKRQRMKEFLERATPEQRKDFPVKLESLLEKKTLGDFTVEELEDIASQIKNLEKLGKTKQKARLSVEKAQMGKTVKEMAEAAKYVKPPEKPKGIDFSRRGLVEAIKAGYLWTLRISRILDWLDGNKGTFDGIWHRTFYDQINRLTDSELTSVDSRIDAGLSKMKEFDITFSELVEVTDFTELQNGLALTKEQMMGIYAGLKNNLATDAIVNGNKIKLNVARAVATNLDAKYKQLTDYIIENDYQGNYGRLREAHIEHANEDLGQEKSYSPMVRLEKTDYAAHEELVNQLLERSGLKRGYAQKGFTIDRKVIAPEHQKPIDLRFISVWQSQIAKQEHYIHFANPLKDLRKILGDTTVKETITQKLGEGGWKKLDNYLSRIANPNIYKGRDGLSGISRTARGAVAIAYLAYNLLTITKQIPSFVLYTKDAGMSAMFSSIVEFAQDPRKMWDEVRTKDPQVKHAFIEREFSELMESAKKTGDKTAIGKLTKLQGQVGKTGMVGIRFIDGVVRTIGWNAVYQKNMQFGLGEAESVRAAQNVTLRTQPSAATKDIAQLYATNEFVNWFTMFTNQLNNIWNITTYDTYAYWKNGKYQDAAMTLMGVSVNAMLIWMLVNKKLPEDDEDLIDAATDQVLNMIPLYGSGAMAGKRGWGTLTPPPIEIGITYGKIMSAKDKEKAAMRALEQSLILTGVPVTAIKRTTKFLETGEPVELIGGRQEKKITLK